MLQPTDDARWQAGYDAGVREGMRRTMTTLMAVVKAAGGKIVVHPSDVEDLPFYEIRMTDDPRTAAVTYEIRRREP